MTVTPQLVILVCAIAAAVYSVYKNAVLMAFLFLLLAYLVYVM